MAATRPVTPRFTAESTARIDAVSTDVSWEMGDAALAGLAVDPDDRLVRTPHVGRSIGRYGTSHRSAPVLARSAKPLLIASWCVQENAVCTRSLPYGWAGRAAQTELETTPAWLRTA